MQSWGEGVEELGLQAEKDLLLLLRHAHSMRTCTTQAPAPVAAAVAATLVITAGDPPGQASS